MSHSSPGEQNIGIEQPRTGPETVGGGGEEHDDAAQIQEGLDRDPDEAQNLTDPDHERDQSTGDA